ncbi:MAG: hypothetical protein R2880_08000 [Deinococcales bacterium]
MIRRLSNGRKRVLRYSMSQQRYTTIFTSPRTLEHPSVSDDGNVVAWLQDNGRTNVVRYKTLSTRRTVNFISSRSDIEHPHMTSDAGWVAYGLVSGNSVSMYAKNVQSRVVSRLTYASSSVEHLGMYWQLGGSVQGPENDDFVAAAQLSGLSGQSSGNNLNASKESGEPNHAGNSGGASVWWSWTAPDNGVVTIDTNGSNFDTTLGVYTGSGVDSLTEVASDDDAGDDTQSLVSFDAVSGTTYQIAVDGYDGVQGDIVLNWNLVTSQGPVNDNFANRLQLSGSSGQTTTSNTDASKESGEPNHAGNSGGASLWWSWTAPSSGVVTIDTNGSNFDTTLGVYTGSSVNGLTEVASDDDAGNDTQSLVSFSTTSGTVYQIAVDGYDGTQGNIVLNWNHVVSSDEFKITLVFGGTITSGQRQVFETSANRWAQIITADIPDTSLNKSANACGAGEPSFSGAIDDVVIYASVEPIDGPGNVLGSAGPCYIRTSGSLPVYGIMRFDSADVAGLEQSGMFDEVILHEMGHVIGIGSLWSTFNLVSYAPTTSSCRTTSSYTSRPRFTGAQANSQYAALGGSGNTRLKMVAVQVLAALTGMKKLLTLS